MTTITISLLNEFYELDVSKASLIYLVTSPGFIFGGWLCIKLYNGNVVPRRFLVCLAYVVCGISTVFNTGNLQMVFSQPTLGVHIGTSVMIGISSSFVVTLAFPETVAIVEHVYNQDLKLELS